VGAVDSVLTSDAKTPTTTRWPLPFEDSNFRQGWWITNLLVKIKRQARKEEVLKKKSYGRPECS